MSNTNHRLEISPKTILLILLIPLGVYLLFLIKDIIVLLFISLLLMTALNPLVNKLEKLKLPRGLGIAIAYLIFYSIVSFAIAKFIPPVIDQAAGLIEQIEVPIEVLNLLNFDSLNYEQIQVITNQFSSVPKVFGIISSAFSAIFVFFTVNVITFYLLMERKQLHRSLVWLFGHNTSEKTAEQLVNHIETKIGSWVRGEAALMFIVGLLTFLGLFLLGINYALPLAVIAGILELLPNLGPVISAIPAIMLAYFSVSPTMALVVTLLYIAVQQLENNLIVPMIMKKSVGLNPIVTIIILLVGFRLGGVIGAILAIPLYLVATVVITETTHLRDHNQHP